MKKVLAVLLIGLMVAVRLIQGPELEQGETDLRFREIPFEHMHRSDIDHSLPFLGIAALDVDGDGVDEVFVGGGGDQPDAVFRFEGDAFSPRTATGFDKQPGVATFGAASLDASGDGLDDLFVARESGVTFYENQGDGSFAGRLLDFGLSETTTPLSIALGDIDRDGDVDLYVSGYIQNELANSQTNFDESYGGYSYLLLNDGTNHWSDATKAAGLWRQHNTFTATFVDLDGDAWTDLVVAEDTGVVETWRNRRDGTFERMPNPTVHCYPMGIAAGDLDRDGDMDLFFSNVGPTLPGFMVRGNLKRADAFNTDYILLRNDGSFHFTDFAAEAGVAKLGFGWGVSAADFDNDGRLDLYAAQNYAKFPGVNLLELYPGRLMRQYEGFHFAPVEGVAGIENQHFGISQVVSDFNQDGWPDLVLANVTGPTRAFLNSGGSRSWLTVRLPPRAAWLNTRVVVTASDGRTWVRQAHTSDGLCSDSTDALLFGLGDLTGSVRVEVTRPGQATVLFESVPLRSVLKVTP